MADQQKDPLITSWFSFEIQGQLQGYFQECSGLGSENEIVEYKASGEKGQFLIKKIPGRLKWNNITLKRGITDAMDMWEWRKLVEEGKIAEARKNGTITMLSTDFKPIAKWDLINAWPSKLTGPNANANANEVGIEELEITHEGYKRVQ